MKLIDLRNPLCIEILINGSWSKEIPDDVREQLLAEDMEQFHEHREM